FRSALSRPHGRAYSLSALWASLLANDSPHDGFHCPAGPGRRGRASRRDGHELGAFPVRGTAGRRAVTHLGISTILRLVTANENGRSPPTHTRRGGPVWPPELRGPTQGRPYGSQGSWNFHRSSSCSCAHHYG